VEKWGERDPSLHLSQVERETNLDFDVWNDKTDGLQMPNHLEALKIFRYILYAVEVRRKRVTSDTVCVSAYGVVELWHVKR
jgi:hypothetical protein